MSDPVNQLKIMTVVGTRPEMIKMSRVMNEFENHSKHILVHSGQNFDYELNEIFFKDLGIRKPDYFLNAVGDSVAESIGLIISKADKVFEREKPDALVLYGDTNTCLAVIAAKRRKIPIFHLEAGNRSFDQRIPEEINRKIVDHLSDINLPLTEHARRYLLNEGLRPETVIKIGGTMREVLDYYADDIKSADILSRLRLRSGEYFVVSSHREENVDSPENLSDLLDSLEALAAQYRMPVIVSTHPRTRLRLDVLLSESKRSMSEHIKYLKPFGFFDYVKLQQEAACVLSDSGTITEESSLLGFPAVTIRQSHERPEGMDSGVLIMSGLKSQRVLQAVAIMMTHARGAKNRCQVDDYEQQEVSKKVLKIVVSYVDYINRNVWRFSDC
ncbi:MAG: UDP-N-acetylglucosamine 2-epimerase (non-hydrolyzing) [Acidobacteria bacterium]|nr:UDP-N-acetylglucosamine 2-epimerase (non-hydrolyzing) [Acidobacteriota bacterium]